MRTPENPFLTSGYYSPEYFCDRKNETKQLLNSIQNGQNVTLTSIRRIGKTGLIKHLFYQLPENWKGRPWPSGCTKGSMTLLGGR